MPKIITRQDKYTAVMLALEGNDSITTFAKLGEAMGVSAATACTWCADIGEAHAAISRNKMKAKLVKVRKAQEYMKQGYNKETACGLAGIHRLTYNEALQYA